MVRNFTTSNSFCQLTASAASAKSHCHDVYNRSSLSRFLVVLDTDKWGLVMLYDVKSSVIDVKMV